jgi:hypothetical protein
MEMAQLLVFAIISCIYGVGIFYLLPLSLLSSDADLLMDLMLLVFLGFFFGLALLALNLQGMVLLLL